ncbi:outer membrane beta-barrel protein [Flavobacterium panici]|uniref:Outer membrane protein beta-barrel domain-containing protein n=1 Tax=Flavobacterium panici TaxID=2654843 RepID=A0A9N8J0Z4_9FLAO|nr:outer membrane beta-barrel protein [Flavobacterium panici]CAC9974198.1 hypothetical protein FLAPXU55_01893 [Flavobacterium panici]
MTLTLRSIFICFIFISFFPYATKAQNTGKFIYASIGLGLTTSYYKEKNPEIIDGSGFYAQGEYVVGLTSWFSLRPYAGIIITSTNENLEKNPENYKVTTKAFSLGGKVRICAPIPWVAPFVEGGIGTSIGSFETYIPDVNIKKNGMVFDIPFSFGLALGPKNNIDVAFTYLFHPAADQFSGAVAAGFSFPLD